MPAVGVFVNDAVDADVLKLLVAGTKLVATRSPGFNHIDLGAAKDHGVTVVRVTHYSPSSVAEFAVSLLLALNRKNSPGLQPPARGQLRARRTHGFGLMGLDLY